MKKDRCFKNLIGKASVFFAFLCMGSLLSGCQKASDSINDYLQNSSILNDREDLGLGLNSLRPDKDTGADETADSQDGSELAENATEDENVAVEGGFDFDEYSNAVEDRNSRINGMDASSAEEPTETIEEDNTTKPVDDEKDSFAKPADKHEKDNSSENVSHSEEEKTELLDEEDESDISDKSSTSEKSTEAKENQAADSKSAKADSSSDSSDKQPDEDDYKSSGAASTFDPDKVNKAIDDLITQIEKETGRTGRRKTVEENDEEKGQDATQYFSNTYQEAQRNSLGLSVVDIEELKKTQAGKYAFEHLTDEGQTLYVELLQIIRHRASDVVVSTLDEDVLDVVCQFVKADHPELFYMDGYTYTRYTIGGVLKKISFSGKYIYNAEEIAERQEKIDAYVDTCLAGVPRDADTFSKVKYVYDYLITNTEYDAQAPDNQNICSVFIGGRSVCQGYAEATQYLLNKLGIPATVVTGKVNGVGHTWNLVQVDGEYTYVDTTWGDSSYQMTEAGEGESQKLPFINYTYLCCTTQDIERTHVISETLPVPECTSMKNNYYVREGEYFTECDMNALAELFKKRYADGSNNVTIKCSTKAIYDEFLKSLFTDKKVFSLMEGTNTTVSYSRFEKQYILVIWLY